MTTSTGAFFAGLGTTFAVLALGFGGGLIMAKSAFKEPGGYQSRAASVALAPVRVILPASAEAAQPPQQPETSSPSSPVQQPAKELQAPVEKELGKAEARKAEAEERERKRRYVERKVRRQAEARARTQHEMQQNAPIMAFGADNSPRLGDAR